MPGRCIGPPSLKSNEGKARETKARAGFEPEREQSASRKNAARSSILQALERTLPLAAVIGFTFLAYSNSFRAPFLMDNDELILKDTRVHAVTPDHIQRILTQPYWEIKLTGLIAR